MTSLKKLNHLYKLIPLFVLLLIPMSSCHVSYKLNGAALDYSVYKTIHIGNFPIRAALVYAPLQPMFENALKDYVAQNTRLQVVNGASDLSLEGEITGYSLTPLAVQADAYSAQTRLTITVHVKYTDSKDESKNVDQSFSAYKDFDSSLNLADVQNEYCNLITKTLVELIFNATLGDW